MGNIGERKEKRIEISLNKIHEYGYKYFTDYSPENSKTETNR
jgi:hypothetical protein